MSDANEWKGQRMEPILPAIDYGNTAGSTRLFTAFAATCAIEGHELRSMGLCVVWAFATEAWRGALEDSEDGVIARLSPVMDSMSSQVVAKLGPTLKRLLDERPHALRGGPEFMEMDIRTRMVWMFLGYAMSDERGKDATVVIQALIGNDALANLFKLMDGK